MSKREELWVLVGELSKCGSMLPTSGVTPGIRLGVLRMYVVPKLWEQRPSPREVQGRGGEKMPRSERGTPTVKETDPAPQYEQGNKPEAQQLRQKPAGGPDTQVPSSAGLPGSAEKSAVMIQVTVSCGMMCGFLLPRFSLSLF